MVLTRLPVSVPAQYVQERSGVKQALKGAVQEAGVAHVVETAPNSEFGGPMCINRIGVEGFGRADSILQNFGSLHRRSSWSPAFSRLRRTC